MSTISSVYGWCSGVFAACVLLTAAGPIGHAADRDPPNLVLIIADDQAWRDFGFLDNRLVHTPHLDRLAARSAVYPHGYVPTSVCRPSLATLLTGLYPHQHGIHFNHPPPGLGPMRQMTAEQYRRTRSQTDPLIAAVATLPRILARHGYACLQTGKHWEGNYRQAGFTHGMTRGLPTERISSVTGTRLQANGEPVAHGNGDAGLVIGRETMEPIDRFLSDHAGRQPVFVWYAPFLPHSPFDAPQEFHALLADRPIPKHLRPYYAEIARFDATVGLLLSLLKKHRLDQNSLILFVSDNGFRPDTARHERQNKRSKLSVYEDGLRTPILMHWPGHVRPARHERLVQTVDIVPTLLEAAGLANEVTRRMPGISLLPSARGSAELPERAAFGAVYPNDARTLRQPSQHVRARWIREGHYKLIIPGPARPVESPALFDLRVDPDERVNLYEHAEQSERIRRMRASLDNWWNGRDERPQIPR